MRGVQEVYRDGHDDRSRSLHSTHAKHRQVILFHGDNVINDNVNNRGHRSQLWSPLQIAYVVAIFADQPS